MFLQPGSQAFHAHLLSSVAYEQQMRRFPTFFSPEKLGKPTTLLLSLGVHAKVVQEYAWSYADQYDHGYLFTCAAEHAGRCRTSVE